MSNAEFLLEAKQVVGETQVLTDILEQEPFLNEWRQRRRGKAIAVIKPASTDEVAEIVRLCEKYHIPIVTQGGNTGLVYGSIPDESGNAIVLSLKRLQKIREVDVENNTITVEAGCLLQNVQETADFQNRYFPLSLASEGSCTIGGNLATNAGGTAVLKYGNCRELCLGLEVVTANGEVIHGLRGLRKDNTGYDLKDLYIGSEGTLGIITAAVLKLFPKPKARICVFVSLPDINAAVALLSHLKQTHSDQLCAFELINSLSLGLVKNAYPHFAFPSVAELPYYALLEFESYHSENALRDSLEDALEQALANKIIADAALSETIEQSKQLWQIRESISSAQAKQGKNIKHDISLPISDIATFCLRCEEAINQAFPAARIVVFGHLGDGNLHYNVSPPLGVKDEEFLANQSQINRIVHDLVHSFSGSISAEHGIGELKREELRRYKSSLELKLMSQIKQALDPLNILNPGKIL